MKKAKKDQRLVIPVALVVAAAAMGSVTAAASCGSAVVIDHPDGGTATATGPGGAGGAGGAGSVNVSVG